MLRCACSATLAASSASGQTSTSDPSFCSHHPLYAGCEAAQECPCSQGVLGEAQEVLSLRELVRSRAAAALVRWPRSGGPDEGIRKHLLWLRKFRGVRVSSRAAFPSCVTRAQTFVQPCEIASRFLLQPTPEEEFGGRGSGGQGQPWRQRLFKSWNRTRARPVFWLAFSWSSQFAHWSLEHLPRLWYYLQLQRLLPHAPVLLTPSSLAPWQSTLLSQLISAGASSAGGVSGVGVGVGGAAPPPLMALSPPHHFQSVYVPGMPAHLQLLWTTQAMHVWDRVRQLSCLPLPSPAAASAAAASSASAASADAVATATAAAGVDSGRLVYSLRLGSHGRASGGRVVREAAQLAAGLRGLGFAPLDLETLSLGQKCAALSRVRFLVLECGSALANFPLLPRGATLLLLCMRDHSTSKGCYMQTLAGRYGVAAVHMLRVGEPVDAAAYARQRALDGKNNVQPHSEWTLSVPHVLRAVRLLSGIDAATVARGTGCAPLPSLGASAAAWPASWRGDALDNRSAYRQPGLFSLRFCGEAWWAPRCDQQAIGTEHGWAPCEALVQCESWRWCVRDAATSSAGMDAKEDCLAAPAG